MEEVCEAMRQGVQTNVAPAGRACKMTSSTSFLPSHVDDLYLRTTSCMEEGQKVHVKALLTELGDLPSLL